VLLMVGLEILSQNQETLMGLKEDCYVMATLTQYLQGISNPDTASPFKAEVKVRACMQLLDWMCVGTPSLMSLTVRVEYTSDDVD
jgi:hypothetical protein